MYVCMYVCMCVCVCVCVCVQVKFGTKAAASVDRYEVLIPVKRLSLNLKFWPCPYQSSNAIILSTCTYIHKTNFSRQGVCLLPEQTWRWTKCFKMFHLSRDPALSTERFHCYIAADEAIRSSALSLMITGNTLYYLISQKYSTVGIATGLRAGRSRF
jgi:hypothetical protein